MEKVYILFVHDGEHFNINGVFSSREAAERDMARWMEWPYRMEDPYIEEHFVFPVKEG